MSIEARKIRLLMHLRRSGVTDTRVLSAIERVPRECFIDPTFHDQAYEDTALPIGRGQTISQPLIVALMTQGLGATDRHKVLEVGTGSGYQTAILARICRRVYSIERHRPLLREASRRLEELRLHNVTAKVGDGMKGWKEQAPFDSIIVTAAAPGNVPPALLEQLAPGGTMVIPMGADKASQALYKITRDAEGNLAKHSICPVRFVPLLPDIASDEPEARPGMVAAAG